MQQGVKAMIVAEIVPQHHAAGSQIFPLHLQRGDVTPCFILQWGVKSYCCMMQQVVKSYRRMMQLGVNLAVGSQVYKLWKTPQAFKGTIL
jgi:hypothetical protein